MRHKVTDGICTHYNQIHNLVQHYICLGHMHWGGTDPLLSTAYETVIVTRTSNANTMPTRGIEPLYLYLSFEPWASPDTQASVLAPCAGPGDSLLISRVSSLSRRLLLELQRFADQVITRYFLRLFFTRVLCPGRT